MPTHEKDIWQDAKLLLQNEQYASLAQYLKVELPKIESEPLDLVLLMLNTLISALAETNEQAKRSLELYESVSEKKDRLVSQLKYVLQEISAKGSDRIEGAEANEQAFSHIGLHNERPLRKTIPSPNHLWHRLKDWLSNSFSNYSVKNREQDSPSLLSEPKNVIVLNTSLEESVLSSDELVLGEVLHADNYAHSTSYIPEDRIPSLAIYCLGAFRVFQDDQAINNWKSNKGTAILKYLVAYNPKPISKEMLMDVFWPESDLESARRNLHQAVYSLRQALRIHQPELQHIRYENDSYSLDPDIVQWIDFEAFEQRLQNGRRLEADGRIDEALKEFGIAEGLYQGGFLEENLYDDWAIRKREYLQTRYLSVAIRLIRHYQERKEFTAATALCHKLLNLDPSYEPAHRHLIRCLLSQGQRHLAVRQYQTCVQILRDELGLEPDEKTAALYHQINATPQSGPFRGISAD